MEDIQNEPNQYDLNLSIR